MKEFLFFVWIGRPLHPALLRHTCLMIWPLPTLLDDIKYTHMYTSLMHQLSLPLQLETNFCPLQ